MDLTGARWGLDRAEAILKLRAIRSSGDFGESWRYTSPRSDDLSTNRDTPAVSSPHPE